MTRQRRNGYTLSEAYLLMRQGARERPGAAPASVQAGEVRTPPVRATRPAEIR